MDDQSSTKKKKKRGRSLIFKYCFKKSGSQTDDPSSSSDKILASDDNLVYCDVSTNGNSVDSVQAIKKSSSSRGRMSRIFKAVLFDTAMKKKMKSKKSIKATSASAGSSPLPDYEKMSNSFNENIIVDMNIKNNPVAGDSPTNDRSTQIPLSPKTAATAVDSPTNDRSTQIPTSPKPAATPTTVAAAAIAVNPSSPVASPSTSSGSPSKTSNPQILTDRPKITSRVDSMKRKPPLPPSYPRVDSMKKKSSIPAAAAATTTTTTTRDRKPADINNPKVRLSLLILLTLFVTVVLWTIYAAIAAEPLDIGSDPYTDIVITGDEL